MNCAMPKPKDFGYRSTNIKTSIHPKRCFAKYSNMHEICRSCSPAPEITVPSLMLILSDSTSPGSREGFLDAMLNDVEPTSFFHLNGADLQSDVREHLTPPSQLPSSQLACNIFNSVESMNAHGVGCRDESLVGTITRTSSSTQKDFGEELNLEPNLSPNFEQFSIIDDLYRCDSFNFNNEGQADLPSPNQMRADILSLWDEVASQLVEPVTSAHRPLREPTHLAHRVPSSERMPPRKRFHAHSWDRLSLGLLGVPRSPHATPRQSYSQSLADSPRPCTARAWSECEPITAQGASPCPLAHGGGSTA